MWQAKKQALLLNPQNKRNFALTITKTLRDGPIAQLVSST